MREGVLPGGVRRPFCEGKGGASEERGSVGGGWGRGIGGEEGVLQRRFWVLIKPPDNRSVTRVMCTKHHAIRGLVRDN